MGRDGEKKCESCRIVKLKCIASVGILSEQYSATDLLFPFTNAPLLSLVYKLYSCSPLGRWLWWKRSAFRGLLATASALLICGYWTWASPFASICLHLSHSVCASQCLCLSQQSLIICSRYNKCFGTLSVRHSFDKNRIAYIHVYIHIHVCTS